jgi:hypothetical protein
MELPCSHLGSELVESGPAIAIEWADEKLLIESSERGRCIAACDDLFEGIRA